MKKLIASDGSQDLGSYSHLIRTQPTEIPSDMGFRDPGVLMAEKASL